MSDPFQEGIKRGRKALSSAAEAERTHQETQRAAERIASQESTYFRNYIASINSKLRALNYKINTTDAKSNVNQYDCSVHFIFPYIALPIDWAREGLAKRDVKYFGPQPNQDKNILMGEKYLNVDDLTSVLESSRERRYNDMSLKIGEFTVIDESRRRKNQTPRKNFYYVAGAVIILIFLFW